MTYFDYWGIAAHRSDGIPKAVKLVGDIHGNPRIFESPQDVCDACSALNEQYGDVFEVYGLTIELHKIGEELAE